VVKDKEQRSSEALTVCTCGQINREHNERGACGVVIDILNNDYCPCNLFAPRSNEATHAIGEPRCTLCGSARLVRNSQPLACSFTQCRDPLHDFCVENGVRCGAIDPPWPDTLPCTREKGHRGSHRSDRLPPENGWVSWPNDEPGAYDEQRPQEATTKENGMRCSHCGNDICDPCWKARVDRRIGSDLSEDALGRIEGMIRGAKSVEEIWTTPADAMSLIREVRRRRAEVGDEYTRANAVRDKVQVDPRVAEVVSAATALCEDEDARAWSRLRFALDALPLVVAEQRLDYPPNLPRRMHGRLERMAADLRYRAQTIADDSDRADGEAQDQEVEDLEREASIVERCANALVEMLQKEQRTDLLHVEPDRALKIVEELNHKAFTSAKRFKEAVLARLRKLAEE